MHKISTATVSAPRHSPGNWSLGTKGQKKKDESCELYTMSSLQEVHSTLFDWEVQKKRKWTSLSSVFTSQVEVMYNMQNLRCLQFNCCYKTQKWLKIYALVENDVFLLKEYTKIFTYMGCGILIQVQTQRCSFSCTSMRTISCLVSSPLCTMG